MALLKTILLYYQVSDDVKKDGYNEQELDESESLNLSKKLNRAAKTISKNSDIVAVLDETNLNSSVVCITEFKPNILRSGLEKYLSLVGLPSYIKSNLSYDLINEVINKYNGNLESIPENPTLSGKPIRIIT